MSQKHEYLSTAQFYNVVLGYLLLLKSFLCVVLHNTHSPHDATLFGGVSALILLTHFHIDVEAVKRKLDALLNLALLGGMLLWIFSFVSFFQDMTVIGFLGIIQNAFLGMTLICLSCAVVAYEDP